jgi:hypothetical protein
MGTANAIKDADRCGLKKHISTDRRQVFSEAKLLIQLWK